MTAKLHKSARLRVFGSRATGSNRSDSDIDVLLEGDSTEIERIKRVLLDCSVEQGGPLDLFVLGQADNEIDLVAAYSDASDPRVVGVGDEEDLDEIMSGAYDISLLDLIRLCEEVEPAWSARSSHMRGRHNSYDPGR